MLCAQLEEWPEAVWKQVGKGGRRVNFISLQTLYIINVSFNVKRFVYIVFPNEEHIYSKFPQRFVESYSCVSYGQPARIINK